MSTSSSARRPVLFGELLFDCFADGRELLGGAPFNVAWHLRGFGLDPLMIGRVGEDPRGDAVLAAMEAWGLSVAGIQRDPDRPTGVVRALLEDGQPHFVIEGDQAYDRLDGARASEALAGHPGGLLCHGTLALRTPAGRRALTTLLREHPLPVLIDLNLRAPWWTRPLVDRALADARWAKLSEEELAVVAGLHSSESEDIERLAQAARQTVERYDLEALLLTRGADGSLAVTGRGDLHHAAAVPVAEFVDAVGAGDAFTAVAVMGLLEGWPLPVLLGRAAAFAAEICSRRGATVADPALYRRHRLAWSEDGAPHG